MAFPTPLIGDIMMLSQLAWKIGFAITFGRAGAPAEFKEVENELKSLTTSITLLAETLNKDDSLITRLDKRTKVGLDKILGFCRQTIEDLDAFVTRYQEIRHENGVDSTLIPLDYHHEPPPRYSGLRQTGNSLSSPTRSPNIHLLSANTAPLAIRETHPKASFSLPPPAISTVQKSQPVTVNNADQGLTTDRQDVSTSLPADGNTYTQRRHFQQILERDAVTTCNVRGVSEEYTQPKSDVPGDWKMI
ncbi:hypothetical protein MMC06_006777 [Schaereria dolodes]|nr:hypothetical protein [Schaereria dolodes]